MVRLSIKKRNEVKKAITSFNIKLGKANNINNLALPFKLNYNEFIKSFDNIKDLNNELKQLKKATVKNLSNVKQNKKGVALTEFEEIVIKSKLKSVNAKRRNELNKKANKNIDVIDSLSLSPKKFNFDVMSNDDLKQYRKILNNQVKKNYLKDKKLLYKENYIKSLESLGQSKKVKLLINKIKNMTVDKFIKTLFLNPEIDIYFNYDIFQENDDKIDLINEKFK